VATSERHLQQRSGLFGQSEHWCQEKDHRQSAERELSEREERAEQRVGCGSIPQRPGAGQLLTEHDRAEDNVDHQPGDHSPGVDGGGWEEAIGIVEFSQHLRSEEKDQKARDHAGRDEELP